MEKQPEPTKNHSALIIKFKKKEDSRGSNYELASASAASQAQLIEQVPVQDIILIEDDMGKDYYNEEV